MKKHRLFAVLAAMSVAMFFVLAKQWQQNLQKTF